MNAEKALELARVAYPNDENLRVAYMLGLNAGAEWQAEQLLKGSPLPEDTVLFNKGVAEGRRLAEEELSDLLTVAHLQGADQMKELMMKDAVEGVAHPDDCEIWVNLVGYGYDIKEGDKVRIIVIPNTDEK